MGVGTENPNQSKREIDAKDKKSIDDGKDADHSTEKQIVSINDGSDNAEYKNRDGGLEPRKSNYKKHWFKDKTLITAIIAIIISLASLIQTAIYRHSDGSDRVYAEFREILFTLHKIPGQYSEKLNQHDFNSSAYMQINIARVREMENLADQALSISKKYPTFADSADYAVLANVFTEARRFEVAREIIIKARGLPSEPMIIGRLDILDIQLDYAEENFIEARKKMKLFKRNSFNLETDRSSEKIELIQMIYWQIGMEIGAGQCAAAKMQFAELKEFVQKYSFEEIAFEASAMSELPELIENCVAYGQQIDH